MTFTFIPDFTPGRRAHQLGLMAGVAWNRLAPRCIRQELKHSSGRMQARTAMRARG